MKALSDFNSTMVRLEDTNLIEVIFALSYFNSTMVRLEVCKGGVLLHSQRNFNSTMVRLEAVFGCGTAASGLTFQFHYGSIGSIRPGIKYFWIFYISIPLWFDWKLLTCPTKAGLLYNFNSTMVRLEAGMAHNVPQPYADFNSTMVRLEAFGLCQA